jgi:hypothetical protein
MCRNLPNNPREKTSHLSESQPPPLPPAQTPLYMWDLLAAYSSCMSPGEPLPPRLCAVQCVARQLSNKAPVIFDFITIILGKLKHI